MSLTTDSRLRRGCSIRRAAPVTVLALVAAACSGSDDAGVASDTEPPAGITTEASDQSDSSAPRDGSLGGVTFRPTTADPLDRIDLVGVPDDIDPLLLDLRLDHDGVDAVVAVFTDDIGPYFLAPIHPDTPMRGGAVTLALSAANRGSPPIELDVGGLPASEGSWDEFVARFRASISDSAAAAGLTFDELARTDAADISSDLFALKLAQLFVDDGTDTDLESLLDDPAYTADDRALVDALTERIGLASLLPRGTGISGFGGGPLATTRYVPSGRTASQILRQNGDCFDAGIEVADAADLAQKMTTARDNAIAEDGAEQAVLDGVSSVTAVGGFIPGIGAGIGAVGTGFSALQLYLNGSAALFPNRLQRIRANVPTEPFPEDTDAADQWTEVKVVAVSSRWTADADVFGTALSAASTAGSVASGAEAMNMGDLEGFALDSWQTARDSAALEIIEDQGGIIEFCPDDWTIDITGTPYSEGISKPERFEVDSDAQLFKPMEVGLDAPFDATLEIRAVADTFGGSTVSADYEISVAAIDIDASDEIIVNRAGQEVDVTATINNAVNPELDWIATRGGWSGNATVTNSTGDRLPSVTWSRTHTSAGSPEDYPYSITLQSLTTGGLQADGSPSRTKQITVRLADIIIDPADGSVVTEGTLGYTATDSRGNAIAVDWQATGGTIGSDSDNTATYTAGSTPGTYAVTAISRSDSQVRATVPVEVVEAECPTGNWELRSQHFLDQIGAASGAPARLVHSGGTFTIRFDANRTFVATRTNWQFKIATPEGTVTITISGTDTGTWSIDDSRTTLTIGGVATNNTVSASLEAAGQQISLGNQTPVDTSGIGGSGGYECAGGVLTVTHDVTLVGDQIG